MLTGKSLSLETFEMRTAQSQAAIQHFETTLKMLNESMGMCLPTTLTINRQSPAIDGSNGPKS